MSTLYNVNVQVKEENINKSQNFEHQEDKLSIIVDDGPSQYQMWENRLRNWNPILEVKLIH